MYSQNTGRKFQPSMYICTISANVLTCAFKITLSAVEVGLSGSGRSGK